MSGRIIPERAASLTHFRSRYPIFLRVGAPVRQKIILLMFSWLFGLLAYMAFLLALPAHWQKNQSVDYSSYYEPVAENLVSGKGLSLMSKPALDYPPGAPLLYAATFWTSDALATDRAGGLRILQAFFVMSSSMLVGLVAWRVFSLRTAFAASILWSTYPFHLWLTKQPDCSAALTTLLLWAVLVFLSWTEDPRHPWSYGVAVGAILAVAALIRPISIALPLVFVSLAWVCRAEGRRRQRLTFSICILVAYVVLLSPWEIWARRVSGTWIPLCTNGPNALIDGITFGAVRNVTPVPMPQAVRALTKDAVARYDNLKTTGSIVRYMIIQTRERPVSVMELYSLKAVRSWYGSESRSFERAVALIQLCYLPFVFVGLRKAFRGGGYQQTFFQITVGIVLYFWAMTVFTALPLLRYMVPATSLLLLCAASLVDIFTARTETPTRLS